MHHMTQYPIQNAIQSKQIENTDYREVRLPDSDQSRNPIRMTMTVQNQRDVVRIPIGRIINIIILFIKIFLLISFFFSLFFRFYTLIFNHHFFLS
jgi:hypothetical protein